MLDALNPEIEHDGLSGPLGGRVAVLIGWGSGQSRRHDTVYRTLASRIEARSGTIVNSPIEKPVDQQLNDLKGVDSDLIVAVGGDGTVNAAASLALARDAVLAIMPMGTMNLLAQDYGGVVDPQDIDRGCVRRVDVGFVGERPFFHSAVIGIVPEIAEYREAARQDESLRGRLAHWTEAGGRAIASEPISMRIETEHGAISTATRSVVVSNNPLTDVGVLQHKRLSVDAGRLGVYISDHAGTFAAIKNLVTIGTGRFYDDPEVYSGVCTRVRITPDRERLPITIDGELHEMDAPLEFSLRPRALSVLSPAPGSEVTS